MWLLMKSAALGLSGITAKLQPHPQLREVSLRFYSLSSFCICFTKSRGLSSY